MSASAPSRSDPLASAIGGAAAGALALGALSAVEILARLGAQPALSAPLRDLSTLAIAGAGGGLVAGALRSARPLRSLSPFGLVLGTAIALHLWLARVSGSQVLAESAAREAVRGALWVLGGVLAGQALGAALDRWVTLRPHRLRDLAVVLALALPALWPATRPAGDPGRPDVLLLSIDTLRADRLGFAGEPRPVSPHLDRLARRGAVRVRAVTPLPRTLPAFASVMTGVPPHAHGVRDNFHYALGASVRTLAEELRERGWASAAVNSNPVLSHDSGIFRGFDSANDRGDDWSRLGILRGVNRLATLVAMRRGDRDQVVTELALEWLSRRPSHRPYFLWVHWLAPHMPYEPAYPFDRLFDPDYEGEYRYVLDYGEISKGDMTYRCPLPPRVLEHAVALYDGEVATSDRALGRLLRRMELAGDLDRAVVLFVADHGESLLEHGYFFNHGDFVYGPAANVPFVQCGGGATPGSLDTAPASLVDVLPDLLDALDGQDVARDPERVLFGESGFCRFPHLNDRLGGLLPRDVAQSAGRVPDWAERWEAQANRAKQRFVQASDWKLVRSPRPEGDVVELFDLAGDPGESADVSAAHPELVTALGARLDRWIEEGERRSGSAPARTLDDDTRAQMEALGYVGD